MVRLVGKNDYNGFIEAELKQKDLTKKVLGKPQETPIAINAN